MPYRIREVLLVSSPYDAFTLEQDGHLTETLFARYSELNLSSAPRITHASSGSKALELIEQRRFDLVITMVRLADMDVSGFGKRVKTMNPAMPLVLLAFTEAELVRFPSDTEPDIVDHIFLWTGDTRILLSIIKLIEDERNAPFDTAKGGVRIILLVEDSIRRYSTFLSALYEELMLQSHSLIEEGLNDLHKLMRMRARPKILLAKDYDQAEVTFHKYSDHVIALITDVRFPKNGEIYFHAGFDLIKEVRKAKGNDFPILVQSSETENKEAAKLAGVKYADKNSDGFLRSVHNFLQKDLGFGDFVFRMPEGNAVARAGNMHEMEKLIKDVPGESLMEHARKNHFSLWLTARSMFDLAKELRQINATDFPTTEDLRNHLLQVLKQARLDEEKGTIIDFQEGVSPLERSFFRIGSGSIGGKARSVAFANTTLSRHMMEDRFKGLGIRIPKTMAIGSGEFERFLEANPGLREIAETADEKTVLESFLKSRLPEDLRTTLKTAFNEMSGPVAVRSSSLLEDSHFQPFAGIYSTYMLPNIHESKEVRMNELTSAIKAVYASVFSRNAREYIAKTPYKLEEERMGVLIQEMVGQQHGDRFYPVISGIALAHNYYPRGYQKSEEGIVMAALGLGHTIVLGGAALQFSPSTPGILPQYASTKDMVKHSQTKFYALDMSKPELDFSGGTESSLILCELETAEQDSNLDMVGSVYDPAEDRIRDNFNSPGPRVITFNNILRWNIIPLAPALEELLRLFSHGMGCPVEIEFAVDRGDYARSVPRGQKRSSPCLYVLQVRPQAHLVFHDHIRTEGFPEDMVFCHTTRALGHGVFESIRDIVYIKGNDISSFNTPKAALDVGAVNTNIKKDNRSTMFIGPGRWGTTDPRLGIPVQWVDISTAGIIVETNFNDREVEPSQGSHFFHNITSFQIGYLTLNRPDPENEGSYSGSAESFLDFAWLDSLPAETETEFVRHVRLDHPLKIFIDGLSGKATAIKPNHPGS